MPETDQAQPTVATPGLNHRVLILLAAVAVLACGPLVYVMQIHSCPAIVALADELS